MRSFFSLRHFNLFLLLVSICLFFGCSSEIPSGPFDIIYSGNLLGTVAPCKCPGNPAGGIPRRAKAIENLELDRSMRLVVDAGNFSAIRPDTGPGKTEMLLAGMKKLGLDAILTSYRDLSKGIDPLVELSSEYRIPFVGANVLVSSTNERPFPGKKIVELGAGPMKKGIPVAIIGVCRGGPDYQLHKEANVKFENPVDALQRELKSLPKDIRMTILLTDADRGKVEEWLSQVEKDKIGLIISSNSRSFKREIVRVDDIPFATCSRLGKHFEKLITNRTQDGTWTFERNSISLGKRAVSDENMVQFLKKIQEKVELTDNQVGYLDGYKHTSNSKPSEKSDHGS